MKTAKEAQKLPDLLACQLNAKVLKNPQWQHTHIQVYFNASVETEVICFPQQSLKTLEDINVMLQHNIILQSEASCGQVKLHEK